MQDEYLNHCDSTLCGQDQWIIIYGPKEHCEICLEPDE